MLELTIPAVEAYDEDENLFYNICDETVLQLEHSLLSIHKWEMKWKKAFLDFSREKTPEEAKDYVRCMTINRNVDPKVYDYIPADAMLRIKEYIDDPMTASTISNKGGSSGKSGTVKTAETIYADMITLNIPVEFNKWHINTLLTLIKVCDLRQSPSKKMSAAETASYYAELNRKHKPKKK